MNELFIDIETIPTSDAEVLAEIRDRHQVPPLDLSTIVAGANLKDPEKIEADVAKKRLKAIADHEVALAGVEAAIDQAVRKTAVDTSVAEIVCVAWAWDDEPVQSVEGLDEADVLRRFWMDMKSGDQGHYPPCVIAHNSGFDIRGLWRRSIIRQVRPAHWWPIDARPWDARRIQDTMVMWEGVSGKISLDRLCKLLGLPGKGAIDGSMVWDLVKAGRLDDVAAYCRADVADRLRPVYRRLTDAGWQAPMEREMDATLGMQVDDELPDWATEGERV